MQKTKKAEGRRAMSVQLLDKTRKINKLLHNNNSSKVVFNDICEVLSEILESNVLVISKKGKELGNSGFYESKNLKLQVSEGKKVQVTYDLDMFSLYGGFNSHLQVKGSVKVIKPVTWIRKVKGLSEVSNKLKG